MQNLKTIELYLKSAQEELGGAQYNLEGGYFGIAVSRAYYAFLYAANGLLLSQDIIR
ncbi:MAG: HEPN domain-containing protein, partial [Deltaproteobacteria bacterium]|nr:HEPN domain-containing protein [Deltaproteobacteria bacterium]